MKYKILLPLALVTNIMALNIDSAVDIALKNNFNLKKEQYAVDEARTNLKLSYITMQPKVDLSYSYNHKDNLIVSQTKEDSQFNATVSYNLFNGFSDKYNIEASKDMMSFSKYTFKAAEQDLILTVKQNYINYLLNEKNTATMKEALKLYEQQYIDSKNYFNQGLIAKNDLLEVEVQKLQALQNLQTAKSKAKISKRVLQNSLGVILDKNEQIESIAENIDIDINFDKDMLESRSEIQALNFISKSYKNSSISSKSGYYPKIDASFGYNKYGDDKTVSGKSGYPSSQQIAAVNIKWNIYNAGKDNLSSLIYVKKAKQILMQIEDLKLQIDLQFEEAKENLVTAKLNLATAKTALEMSKRNYEIVNNKLQEGIASNKDLIDANYLLTKSKQNYYDAYYGKFMAQAVLQRVLEIE